MEATIGVIVETRRGVGSLRTESAGTGYIAAMAASPAALASAAVQNLGVPRSNTRLPKRRTSQPNVCPVSGRRTANTAGASAGRRLSCVRRLPSAAAARAASVNGWRDVVWVMVSMIKPSVEE